MQVGKDVDPANRRIANPNQLAQAQTARATGSQKAKDKIREELAQSRAAQTGVELFQTGTPGRDLSFGGTEERIAAEQEAVRAGETQRIEEEAIKKEVQLEEAGVKAGVFGTQLEEAGVLEENVPQERNLQPGVKPGEKVPVLGRTGAVVQTLMGDAINKGWIKGIEDYGLPIGVDPTTGEQAFPPEFEATAREIALNQIRQDSFNKGTSFSESFGAYIESIPAAGGLVGKYVGGLVEAPYANANNALDEINKIKEAASTGQEKVRNGLEDPDYGLDRARSMEEDVAELSGRIKLLISQSAVLRANADQVNKIQEQLLEAEEKVARYKKASQLGYIAQATGSGRIIPSDELIYIELKKSNKESTRIAGSV